MGNAVAELRKQGGAVARNVAPSTIKAYIELNSGAVAAALPKHMNPEKMTSLMMTAIRTTPALLDCDLKSLVGALIACAQIGLEPNTPLQHCYLIPFNNRKKGITEVQVIPGYRGLIDLARRSGQIVSIAAHAVFEQDHFVYEYGLNEKLEHRPATGDRGDVTHFYALAKLKGGGHCFEVMSLNDVQNVMKKSQSGGRFGPWKDHFIEMGRKTAVRRLFKYLPVSIEHLGHALELDNKAAEAEPQDFTAWIDSEASEVAEAVADQVDTDTGEVMPTMDEIIAAIAQATTIKAANDLADSGKHLPEEQYAEVEIAADQRISQIKTDKGMK